MNCRRHEPISSVEIKDEWIYINGEKTDWDWKKLVMATFIKRISLSEHAHYTPPTYPF